MSDAALYHTDCHTGSSPGLLRWSACAALVVAAHGFVLLALAARQDLSDLDNGSPIITIELAPLALAPPAPPNDVAPGPLQAAPEQEQRAEAERKPEARQPDPPITEAMRAPDPTVELPLPERPRDRTEPRRDQEAVPETAAPTAPPTSVAPAIRPSAPAIGRVPQPTPAAVASWQRMLIAHLERLKRYPARARGEQGITGVAFSIDLSGHVVASHIVRSSGSPVLDDEALALIRRADPLPRPPSHMTESKLSFMVPIRYGKAGPH